MQLFENDELTELQARKSPFFKHPQRSFQSISSKFPSLSQRRLYSNPSPTHPPRPRPQLDRHRKPTSFKQSYLLWSLYGLTGTCRALRLPTSAFEFQATRIPIDTMSTERQENIFVTPGPESSHMAEIRQGKRRAEEVSEEHQGRRSQAPRLSQRSSLRPTPSDRERVSTAPRSAAPEAPTPDTQMVIETIEIDEDTSKQ